MDSQSHLELRRIEILVAVVGFLTLSVAACFPAGFSTDIVFPGDTADQYFSYLQRAFQPVSPNVAGPWDPTHFTGLPESHCPIGCYYPPTQILFRIVPMPLAFGWALILHHALAGAGAYLLVRSSGLSRAAGWLAGIVFSFGGFMLFQRGHFQSQQVAAWLPLILWSLERYRLTGRGLWILVSGSMLSVQGLAAHMQTVLICGSVWIVYGIYYAIAGTGTNLSRGRFAFGIAAACFLGAMGSMPQHLPMLEVAAWSPYNKVDLAFVAEGNLKARFLVGLLSPWLLVHWSTGEMPSKYLGLLEHGIFFGVLALFLAVAGVVSCLLRFKDKNRGALVGDWQPSRRELGFWLILGLVNLLLMLGENVGVHRLAQFVPIYNRFHVPTRHLLAFGMALAWFAALGLDQLRSWCAPVKRHLFVGVAAASSVLLAACLAASWMMPGWAHGAPGIDYPPYWIALGTGLAAMALFWMLSRATSINKATWPACVFPALAAFELFGHLHGYQIATAPTQFLTDVASFPEPVRWLRDHGEDGRPARFVMQREIYRPLDPTPTTFASSWGLSGLDMYCNSVSHRMARLLHLDGYGRTQFALLLAEEKGLSAAGGKYIVAQGDLLPVAPGLGYQVACWPQFAWRRNGVLVFPRARFPLQDGEAGAKNWEGRVAEFHQQDGQFLVEGELLRQGPTMGTVRISAKLGKSRQDKVLASRTFSPDDFEQERASFALTFAGDKDGILSLHIEAENAANVEVARLDLWKLQPDFASQCSADPREILKRLHEGTRNIYPVAARFANCNIYANPLARSLATLVAEVRPAKNDLAAADAIRHADRPVIEVAFVAAPGGISAGQLWPGPRYFTKGTSQIINAAPDEIHVRTDLSGEGFLVLAVTRCRGWSASIDGQETSIHSVDGPLMGVVVPAGAHEVCFRFRPILTWIGMALAGLVLGGAWMGFFAFWLLKSQRAR